jgi:prophage antirepressor-like protein
MTSLQKLTSTIEIYNFKSQQLRVVGTIEDPWFAAKDICDILGLSNTHQSLLNIPEKWKGVCKVSTINRGDQDMSIVNESGLYKMILRSNKSEAQPFQEWVCEEVLPSIRKKGEYVLEEYKKKLEDQQKLLEEKDKEIQRVKQKYPKKSIKNMNCIYMLTTEFTEKDGIYVIGRAECLSSRMSNYNKSIQHKKVFSKECASVNHMILTEQLVLMKMDPYRDVKNRDIFVLPKNTTVDFFINILQQCHHFVNVLTFDENKEYKNEEKIDAIPNKNEEKTDIIPKEKPEKEYKELSPIGMPTDNITCGCGTIIKRCYITRHELSEFHQNWLKTFIDDKNQKVLKKQEEIAKYKKEQEEKLKEKTNKLERKNRYTCDCGVLVSKSHLTRHVLSVKHQEWLKTTLPESEETKKYLQELETKRQYDNDLQKLYRKENKQKIQERLKTEILCECGSTIQRAHLCVHKKSKLHKDFMAKKQSSTSIV